MSTHFSQLMRAVPKALKFSSRFWWFGLLLSLVLTFNTWIASHLTAITGDGLPHFVGVYLVASIFYLIVMSQGINVSAQIYQGNTGSQRRYLSFECIKATDAFKCAISVYLWISVLPNVITVVTTVLSGEFSTDKTPDMILVTLTNTFGMFLSFFLYPVIVITYLYHQRMACAIHPKYWLMSMQHMGVGRYFSLLGATVLLTIVMSLVNGAIGYAVFVAVALPMSPIIPMIMVLVVSYILFAIGIMGLHYLIGYAANTEQGQTAETAQDIADQAMQLFKEERIDEVILLAESALRLEQYDNALKIASHFIKTHNHHADLLDMQIVAGRALVGKNHLQKAYQILGKSYKQLDKSDARYSELRKELLALKQRIEHTASARKNAQ